MMANLIDLRQESRTLVPDGSTARLSLLTEAGAGPAIPATVENLSGSGMRLIVGQPVALGAAVQVDWNDTLLLGEACYCQPLQGRFAVGLQLEHSLEHLRALEQLRRRFLEEDEEADSTPCLTPSRRSRRPAGTVARQSG